MFYVSENSFFFFETIKAGNLFLCDQRRVKMQKITLRIFVLYFYVCICRIGYPKIVRRKFNVHTCNRYFQQVPTGIPGIGPKWWADTISQVLFLPALFIFCRKLFATFSTISSLMCKFGSCTAGTTSCCLLGGGNAALRFIFRLADLHPTQSHLSDPQSGQSYFSDFTAGIWKFLSLAMVITFWIRGMNADEYCFSWYLQSRHIL